MSVRAAALAIALLSSAAAASPQEAAGPAASTSAEPVAGAPGPGVDPAAAPTVAARSRFVASYRLDAGDRLRITVYDEPELTGQYVVTDAGEVSFPLVGNVPAAGSRLADLQRAVAAGLAKGYVKDPKVSIELVEYRPYYILGEINKPGEYPFRVGMTVQQAVAAGGGYSYRANMSSVYLRRAGEERETKVRLGGPAVPVMPGDTLRVGQRYF